ncbi:hypothetical protein B0H14DRAFT_2964314 [Mycena olivaceomarginata]|nr:hypothetical protein B0H14DRAFT_2964314 [Mycena olivaceomarginata]
MRAPPTTMPLRPQERYVVSMEYKDDSFPSKLALLLQEASFKAATAVQVDDIVILGLFSRIASKPVKRQFMPSLLSASGPPIDLDVVKPEAVADNQTPYEGFVKETEVLVRELWKWGKNKFNLSGDSNGRKALLWAIRAYLPLIAPWAPVHLQVRPMGAFGEVGFGVVAQRAIKQGEYIRELIGVLTPDYTTEQSTLSEMYCKVHGCKHILWGPIRMLNHDHAPNIEWVEVTETRAMVALAIRDIPFGEELLADYGDEFWEHGCPCKTCNPAPPVVASTSGAGMSTPTLTQEERAGAEKRIQENKVAENARRSRRRARAGERKKQAQQQEEREMDTE